MKGAIYIRTSSNNPVPYLDAQVTATCRAANARGIQVLPTSVFVDFGPSGAQPELRALMDAVRHGDIEAVVVAHLTRLGRGFDEVRDILVTLKRAGVMVLCGGEVMP